MHELDEPVVRGLRAAVLEGRCEAWLHELASQALSDREFARAIAAGVIASAGEHAMMVTAGPGFAWDADLDEVVDGQRCRRHDVFCCLACTDETLAPIIALRGRAFGRQAPLFVKGVCRGSHVCQGSLMIGWWSSCSAGREVQSLAPDQLPRPRQSSQQHPGGNE